MALSNEDRKRALELAREFRKITGGRFKADGKSKTFAEIEDEAIEIGDLITSLAINEAAEDAPDKPAQCRCPECGAVPKKREPDDDDEPVVLLTDRGEVDFVTEGYYCRRCRRSFFPPAR
ncbi:hypothetical protein Q31b_31420 [Novipirellula aureliae]|uniref:Uncharacterized protein n=1 Tax=Novipirellula aureliae TaxID=2527966 RepID=A0A5C6DV44_9BACT|nr:hypothetical protein [Novipirellula aureliae]TWU39827.1 hypothetical protein Q31b_31420 [Novipirellula aureliae]